jgi:hypothetical protein
MTSLTADEIWKLVEAGYRPVGIAATSVVFYARSQYSEWRSRELRTLNAGIQKSMGLVRREVEKQGKKL